MQCFFFIRVFWKDVSKSQIARVFSSSKYWHQAEERKEATVTSGLFGLGAHICTGVTNPGNI